MHFVSGDEFSDFQSGTKTKADSDDAFSALSNRNNPPNDSRPSSNAVFDPKEMNNFSEFGSLQQAQPTCTYVSQDFSPPPNSQTGVFPTTVQQSQPPPTFSSPTPVIPFLSQYGIMPILSPTPAVSQPPVQEPVLKEAFKSKSNIDFDGQ